MASPYQTSIGETARSASLLGCLDGLLRLRLGDWRQQHQYNDDNNKNNRNNDDHRPEYDDFKWHLNTDPDTAGDGIEL
jgi:hypothetical protein